MFSCQLNLGRLRSVVLTAARGPQKASSPIQLAAESGSAVSSGLAAVGNCDLLEPTVPSGSSRCRHIDLLWVRKGCFTVTCCDLLEPFEVIVPRQVPRAGPMSVDNFLVDSASDDADSLAHRTKSGHAPTEQGMPRLSQKRKKPFGRPPTLLHHVSLGVVAVEPLAHGDAGLAGVDVALEHRDDLARDGVGVVGTGLHAHDVQRQRQADLV